MNETVSIIIPVYKVEKYLNRCVESVVNQTYSNLEIILVDDGSPDNCPQMCDEWAVKDERIKVIHKENAGLGIARNSGMEMATGDYLMFVDSDDFLSLHAVEVLYRRIKADDSDLAVGKHADAYENGRRDYTYCKQMEDKCHTVNELLSLMGERDFPVAAWGKLYNKEVLSPNLYPALRCGEDMWAFSSVLNKCERVSTVNEEVYYYFQREDSIIHSKTTVAKLDEVEANLHFVRFLLQRSIMQTAKKYFARSINFAYALKTEHLQYVRGLLRKYLERRECVEMLKTQEVIICIKWLLILVAPLHRAVRKIKTTRS